MIVVTLLEKLFQETVVIIFDGGFREATKVAKTDMFFFSQDMEKTPAVVSC